ncbi:catechol 2,3-dioxygenase-like lactoylglutathione lyase family enzyme [Sinorhizobium fredii]
MSTAINSQTTQSIDMKLEVIVVPVSDVDRAKAFYAGLGWRLDADFAGDDGYRVIQFTPPGSGASVIFGKNVTDARPGSAQGLYLIVSDIKAAREDLRRRGVDISEVFHAGDVQTGNDEPYLFGRHRVAGADPERRSYRSYASFRDPDGNGWLFQEVTTRLPGRIDASTTTFASRRGSGKRFPARRGRPRRIREAARSPRRGLADLVRRVHRSGADGRTAARVNGLLHGMGHIRALRPPWCVATGAEDSTVGD